MTKPKQQDKAIETAHSVLTRQLNIIFASNGILEKKVHLEYKGTTLYFYYFPLTERWGISQYDTKHKNQVYRIPESCRFDTAYEAYKYIITTY